MATGITKRTPSESRPPNAQDVHSESLPLPPPDCKVQLSYANKASEREILATRAPHFVTIDSTGRANRLAALAANSVVWADNYNGMLKLLESHAGEVDLAYLDPPYCTGFDFHSRAQRHAYSDDLSEAEYIEFVRRRVILIRELLGRTGSIYLHIGHQMVAHVKIVLDEVFGAANFRNLIVRRKCSSKNYTRRQLPNLHDYILFYTKSSDYVWNRPAEEATEAFVAREYPKRDQRGRYKLVPIHAPGVRNGPSGQSWRSMTPPPGKHWQFTPDRLEAFDKAGEIHWSKNGNPRRKVYFDENKGVGLTDYWPNYRDAHHQSIPITGYPTEKNLNLLKTIVSASSEPDDLVIDPFCGSGTTMDAADALGRKWIGFDASIAAIEASVKRLKHGSVQMGDYVVRSPTPECLPLFEQADAEQPKRQPARFQLVSDERYYTEHEEALAKIALT